MNKEKIIPYIICLVISIIFFSLGYNYNPEDIDDSLSNDNVKEELINENSLFKIQKEEMISGNIKLIDENFIIIENTYDNIEKKVFFDKNTKFYNTIIKNNETIKELVSKQNFILDQPISILFINSTAIEVEYSPNPHTGEDQANAP